MCSPLCFGTKRDENGNILEFAAASESVAVESLGIDRERDVGPGEVIFMDMNMTMHTHVDSLAQPLHTCIFEFVYFARPDSVIRLYTRLVYRWVCDWPIGSIVCV